MDSSTSASFLILSSSAYLLRFSSSLSFSFASIFYYLFRYNKAAFWLTSPAAASAISMTPSRPDTSFGPSEVIRITLLSSLIGLSDFLGLLSGGDLKLGSGSGLFYNCYILISIYSSTNYFLSFCFFFDFFLPSSYVFLVRSAFISRFQSIL